MEEWMVAVILIGVSVLVTAALMAACKALGGWSYLFAWVTGSKDERVNLASQDECGAYVDFAPNINNRILDHRPPLIEPQNCFSTNLKSSEKWSDVSNVIAAPLPPPPHSNEVPSKRFSLDIIRRTSIDASELPDVLALENTGSAANARLQRAMSCDSVCSDTSVVLEALDSPDWSGELNIGVEFLSQRNELVVIVKQARGLPTLATSQENVDSYVRLCLQPDKTTTMQTEAQRATSEPQYNERFVFAGVTRDRVSSRTLQCSVYGSGELIGESELRLSDIDLGGPYQAWIPIINPKQKSKGIGELLFSLSYLPTAERMTVVLVKARNIVWSETKPSADLFVKVYLLQKGKKISKKKTSVKKGDRNPTFNEAMIFSVPASALQNIQLRLTLAEHEAEGKKAPAVGHVFVGPQCSGKQLSHWNQMISSPRKPIAMWHPLRKREH